jgi:hypothetical protein
MEKRSLVALAFTLAFHIGNAAADARILVPFELVGIQAEYHVMAWFTGHPDYESVEAFVYGDGQIRAILTRHGGSQIDAFNYDDPDLSSGREWYATDITFALARNGKDARLEMGMPNGKRLVLSFAGQGKPNPRHGGLTDPGNHSVDTGLPAMYRRASSVSGSGSSITIDGKAYEIPMDKAISRPPFFTAYSAFLSQGFESLFIRAYDNREITSVNCASSDGSRTGRATYRTGASLNIVTLSWHGNVPVIAAIASSSEALSPKTHPTLDGRTEIRFEPPLVDIASVPDSASSTGRFAIVFRAGKDKAVEGTVTVSREGDRVSIVLQPEKPEWLRATRAIRYDIDLGPKGAFGSAIVLRANQGEAR